MYRRYIVDLVVNQVALMNDPCELYDMCRKREWQKKTQVASRVFIFPCRDFNCTFLHCLIIHISPAMFIQ